MAYRVRLEGIDHFYGESDEGNGARALEDVALEIEPGAFAILMGPSGSGKSTLLNLIGAIDRPTRGRIFLGDHELSSMTESDLTMIRRRSIGFIFQFFNLIPTLSVSENIEFPLALGNVTSSEARARTEETIDRIGLTARARHYPNQLSGGEMQRVAIGRAIVHRPDIILADEPTGNLDSQTGERILELIRTIHQSYQPTIVMATHSERAASFGDFVIDVIDGRVTRRPDARRGVTRDSS
ncbi:MAG TPA: ABC transporter ATP-binding protein [Thermoanaerobaculia bacterium]|nr:ABC transporter ATP-binding protein [Thermoanaerobaculia bacterium]